MGLLTLAKKAPTPIMKKSFSSSLTKIVFYTQKFNVILGLRSLSWLRPENQSKDLEIFLVARPLQSFLIPSILGDRIYSNK